MPTKTITIDTGEWSYPDASGTSHPVTDGQTFTFTLTDGGASAVKYAIDNDQSVATDDGYTIYFRPRGDVAGNSIYIGFLADANDTTEVHDVPGELIVEDPTSGQKQIWKIAKITIDDIDAPTSISMTCEDQFGNLFTWDGVTIS